MIIKRVAVGLAFAALLAPGSSLADERPGSKADGADKHNGAAKPEVVEDNGAQKPAASGSSKANGLPKGDKPRVSEYRLTRTEIELRLGAVPFAPVHCTAEAADPLLGRTVSATVSWSPAGNDPLVQYVRFPNRVVTVEVFCSGDLRLQGTDPATTSWIGYEYDKKTLVVNPPAGTEPLRSAPLTLTARANPALAAPPTAGPPPAPKAAQSGSKPDTRSPFELQVSATATTRDLSASDLETSNGTAVARARSNDPLTPVLNDVLVAITGVVIDKADAGAMQLIKQRLIALLAPLPLQRTSRVVQALRFEDIAASGHELERALIEDVRTYVVSRLSAHESVDPAIMDLIARFDPIVAGYLDGTSIPSERDFQLVVYDVARLKGEPGSWQWLASIAATVAVECASGTSCSADQLSRALEREAMEAAQKLATQTGIRERLLEPVKLETMKVDADLHAVLTGKDLANWNEASALLDTYFGDAGKLEVALNELKSAVESGKEIQEKLRQLLDTLDTLRADFRHAVSLLPTTLQGFQKEFGKLSDDQAKRLKAVAFELAALSASIDGVVTAFSVLKAWPELPSIVARLAEVLQPPPGASPRKTATIAAQLTFDILDHALVGKSAEAQRAMKAARTLTVATINGDTRAALGVALTEIAFAVDDADHSSARASEMLGAVVQYAATYTRTDDKDPNAAATAASERKSALNRLVTSLTDRSQRQDGDGVLSLAASVGIGYTHGIYKKTEKRGTVAETTTNAATDYPALMLPLGFAYDKLPGPAGLHVQVNLLDLAQYVSVSTDGDLAKTTLGTAVNLGGTVGITFGSKTTPFMVAATGGWAPGLKLGPDAAHAGQFTIGAVVGTYVPLVDFN